MAGRPVRLLWRGAADGRTRSWVLRVFARYTDGTALPADFPGRAEAGGERALQAAAVVTAALSGARRGGRPVVAVGAHVRFRGAGWQIVALSGQCFHLVGESGDDEVVPAGHLFADPDFAVRGAGVGQPRWGLFETAPAAARERALAWQRYIREVECGRAGGPDGGGVVRPEYDPARFTSAERERATAEDLTALGFGRVSRTTVQRMRGRYRRQGLWGLVDKRATRGASATGRSDERVVVAVLEALRRQRGRSKGTVEGLRRLAGEILDRAHGPGVVALPSRATFYRLVNALADPAELPARTASATTPPPFAPVGASRPGEQVRVDSTRLDVMAVLDDGRLGRPELTIAVDVATRSIVAAVLRPEGTKAVDAALFGDGGAASDAAALARGVGVVAGERALRAAGGGGRAVGGRGGAAGDRAGDGRGRPGQGVRVRGVCGGVRDVGGERAARAVREAVVEACGAARWAARWRCHRVRELF
ncbi:hypothetical protein ACIBSV_37695 [Embleya sp. NPDC050154]|uniref:hypothetical protein n=1 Tax=Embleya sp. NPDC050154 TaxID=3363988 RepID=UPI0037A16005